MTIPTEEAAKEAIDKAEELGRQGRHIDAGFARLRLFAIPPEAGHEQIHEMRFAFFGGAQQVFNLFMMIGQKDAKQQSHMLEQLAIELKAFGEQMMSEEQKKMAPELDP